MLHIKAVLEIAHATEELKRILLPHINEKNHSVSWDGVASTCSKCKISVSAIVALAWARSFCFKTSSNEDNELMTHGFQNATNEVREAIGRAILIRYAADRRDL